MDKFVVYMLNIPRTTSTLQYFVGLLLTMSSTYCIFFSLFYFSILEIELDVQTFKTDYNTFPQVLVWNAHE